MTQEYYTSVCTKFGKILYRGYKVDESGERKRVQGKLSFSPTLYTPVENENSQFKALFANKPLQEKKFSSISDARTYIKEYQDIVAIHGYSAYKFEYEFIARTFPKVLAIGISDICVGTIDIETTVENGKMDVINVPEEITLITYQNLKTKKLVTFGSRISTTENYIKCKDESDVLSKFIAHIQLDDPDVITGWNSEGFDIPYIINKSYKLLGEVETKKLSPFNIIEMREINVNGKIQQKFDIVGRECLDMLELYKKFTFVKRDNNRLDTIATVELGVGKLENPFNTFREFYSGECNINVKPTDDQHPLRHLAYERTMLRATVSDDDQKYVELDNKIKQGAWEEFVRYNQIDVVRVSELEDKLGLISLALSIAYLTKCNYTDVFSPVKYWECYILSTLLNENVFCEIKRKETVSESLDGAYVMEPKPGFYAWIISIDGEALYPSIIRGLNMSPETIIDKLHDCDIQGFLDGKQDFSKENFSVAANGTKFTSEHEGVMCKLVSNVLDGRRTAKNSMLESKQDKENLHEELVRRGIVLTD